ncbi:MAG: molybdopterin-synthase adenylyltransferase MoeB [Mycobacteriaceae bacterium]
MVSLPPLVVPAEELSPQEIARYSRHLVIPEYGVTGQKRLKNARVLVIGAGGLGSPVLLYLAAAGVGTIGIVDFDKVELSNLQRQIIHGHNDIGRYKGESARESIRRINPEIEVRVHAVRLEVRNAINIFQQYDLVIDGSDNFATRYLVNDAAVLAKKPYVWGSIFRFEGQVSVFWEAAPDGRGLNYRDIYPEPPPAGSVPSCVEGGVLGVLCASIGAIMATEAIKLITGIGESLLGRLLIYSALDMTYQSIVIRKDPDSVPITKLSDYQLSGPNVESSDKAIAPQQLAQLLENSDKDDADTRSIVLIDVREQVEWDIVRIEGSILIPQSQFYQGTGLAEVPQNRRVVLYCKNGVRSAEVLEVLVNAGFSDAMHLAGGLVEWIRQIDPTLPSY